MLNGGSHTGFPCHHPACNSTTGLRTLQQVSEIFMEFGYTRQFVDALGENAVLEFTCSVGGIAAQGVLPPTRT